MKARAVHELFIEPVYSVLMSLKDSNYEVCLIKTSIKLQALQK